MKNFVGLMKGFFYHLPGPLQYKIRFVLFKRKGMYQYCAYGKTYIDLLTDAFDTFLSDSEKKDEALLKKLTNDNICCWLKLKALPYEFFLFDFRNKTDEERYSFETDVDRILTLRKVSSYDAFVNEINNKYNFFLLTKPYYKRKVFLFDEKTTFVDFLSIANELKYMFVKPIDATKGQGIRIIHYYDEVSLKKDYDVLRQGNSPWLIEEKICQCDEMAQWNPTSVNTIRIPSFYRNGKFTIIWTRMRMGKKGAIVDNVGAGGIVVNVNPSTGVIETDGYDDSYQHFVCNPETGLRYKGWQVPRWSELLQIVEEMHKTIFPKHVYIAWDFALTPDGWVVIEANWGQLLGQQIVSQVGVRKQFHELVGAE